MNLFLFIYLTSFFVFTTVIASYQDVPYSVQPVIEKPIPEQIYPKPVNSESSAPYSETTTYDNNQVINDISKFSIEDSAKPAKPYNSYPSYDPYDSYHSHSHYHPCPKVRKIEKVVYKIKKVKVPVPMIVKKNVYPIKVMLPYKKKRYPKKYKKKAVIIIKGKIKYGKKKKKKYYDEEYYDNPTAHAEISDESDKPETVVESPTKSLNPWDPKTQDPAQFDYSGAKKEKDDKSYWDQKYEQTLKEFDFDLNSDSVRK